MTVEEKTPPRRSVDSYIREYCEYTTTHGFGRLAAARGVLWHVFWICMIVGAHTAFYYHTYLIVQDYNQKPIRTKVTMRHGQNLVFPTVTICNRNTLRKSKLPLDFINKIAEITAKNETKKSKNATRKSPNKKALPDPELKHSAQAEWELLRHLFNKYNTSELENYGHQLENMILDCKFNGEDCSPSSTSDEAFTWRHIWLDDVGNCYMFNRALNDDGKDVEAYKSVMAGDTNGLQVLLNVEQHEYLDGISPYAGIRVVIETQGHMPFPQSQGIDLAPGLATGIELRQHHISRLDPFYNNSCENTGKLDLESVFWVHNMTYSKMACKLSCLISMQRKKCQCAQYHLPSKNDLHFCDYTNTTVTECLDDVYSLFLEGYCDQACPPPCSETYFTTTISSTKWPSNSYKKRLNKILLNDFQMSMTDSEISDNLIDLQVYYADLDYVHVEETLKYEIQDIISNVGGQLGMWIGVSAISIAEVIELFIIVVNFLIKNRKQQNSVNVQRIDVR